MHGMRALCAMLIGALLCFGCASQKSSTEKQTSTKKATGKRMTATTGGATTNRIAAAPGAGLSVTNGSDVITLTNPLVGKVAAVNTSSRFVVVSFFLRQLPAIDQRLNVYRQGVKVGVIKISGPVMNGNVVGDLVAGEVQVGDEARSD